MYSKESVRLFAGKSSIVTYGDVIELNVVLCAATYFDNQEIVEPV